MLFAVWTPSAPCQGPGKLQLVLLFRRHCWALGGTRLPSEQVYFFLMSLIIIIIKINFGHLEDLLKGFGLQLISTLSHT